MGRLQTGTLPSRSRDAAEYGGATSGVTPYRALVPGQFYDAQIIEATRGLGNVGSGFYYHLPFLAPRTFSINLLGLRTAGVASGLARVAVYGDTGAAAPGSLLLDTGNLDTSTAGYKSVVVNFTFTAGVLYWLSSQISTNTSCSQPSPGSTLVTALTSGSDASGLVRAYSSSASFGAFPTTAAAVTRDSSNVVPSPAFRVAS